ncbi:MAG: LysE family translocator [Rhodospirillales bacterium]|nr:LysE family translocator [Rhodospirillales bacterium]
MTIELWLLYLLASVGLSLTPGPNGLLALTHGALYGLRRSIFTVSGGVVGFTMLMGISMAGMGALLLASQQAFLIVKWIGAAYLVYLGVKVWRSPPPHVGIEDRQGKDTTTSRWQLFSNGFFVAVANPKAIIFFAAFLPQFIDPATPKLPQFFILAGTYAFIEFVYEALLAGSAQKFSRWLSKGNVGKWFNRISGATFISIGGLLLTVNKNS